MLIDIYLTDTVIIVTTAADLNGAITKSDSPEIPARIEDVNILVKNRNGKEVMSNTFLILNTDAVITYESKIKLITKNGSAYPLAAKEMAIMKLIKSGGFDASHYEVWL